MTATLTHLDRLLALPERTVWQALGLILSGALVLLWAGLKITPKQIGA